MRPLYTAPTDPEGSQIYLYWTLFVSFLFLQQPWQKLQQLGLVDHQFYVPFLVEVKEKQNILKEFHIFFSVIILFC